VIAYSVSIPSMALGMAMAWGAAPGIIGRVVGAANS